jgi:hypothetical protein
LGAEGSVSFGDLPRHYASDAYLKRRPPELYRDGAERLYRWLLAQRSCQQSTLATYLWRLKRVFEKLGKKPGEVKRQLQEEVARWLEGA